MIKQKHNSIPNFRDASKFNSNLKSNIIYRSSALCLVKDDKKLNDILDEYAIQTIIDLRADRELKEHNYSDSIRTKYRIIHAPFDPWNQSIEFKNKYNYGSNIEIAYRFFSLECKLSIKIVMETILDNPNATVIHCHAGKDRTGIVFTLFHLLCNATKEVIFLDYLASEMDTKKEYLQILLDIIEEQGGIESYLLSCKITRKQIKLLKEKLCNN